MALIALDETKTFLGVTGSADDTLLNGIITRVIDFIEVQTGRYFDEDASHTEYFDGNATDTLYLNEPATSITSVHYRNYPGDTWTEITAGADDGFELRDRMLIRKGYYSWQVGVEYRVIYAFGYATGPEDVRQLAMDLVKMKYGEAKIDANAGALQSYRIGDTAWTRALGISNDSLMSIPWVAETISYWRGRRWVA